MQKRNSKSKVCEVCKREFLTKYSRTRFCSKECISTHTSQRRKREIEALTPEQRREWAIRAEKKGREISDEMRQAVRENTEEGRRIKEKIKSKQKQNWKDLSEEEKNSKVALLQKNASQSELSKEIKAALYKAGLRGFLSEQVFKGKIPDEINHEKKLIIEIFGDYFHANPALYPDNEYMSLFQCTAKERRARDEEKLRIFDEAGYKTYIIWESLYEADSAGTINDAILWVMENSK